jgi:hypothetical protein
VNALRLDVPAYVLRYALNKYHRLRPRERRSGIPDAAGNVGKGDFFDLVATEVLHNFFSDRGKEVGSFVVSGRGDFGIDLVLWDRITSRRIGINIKTSEPPRMRAGLHLILKHEELVRPNQTDVYIQCIMRAGRPDPAEPTKWLPSLDGSKPVLDPHLYVLGWAQVNGPGWDKLVVRPIVNTPDQHPGGHIVDSDLRPIEELVALSRDATFATAAHP